uniref:Bacterial sugar transferase domain-containing protein n=2 Tax=Desulfobacterium TaxID=2295 RepID=E1YJF3_9BACT|nr:hypothetical protein N47_E49190 [uncultured Desulfobacterium sp.]
MERKRTERSKKPFLLMMLDISELKTKHNKDFAIEKIKEILISCLRETDISGWYEANKIMGSIFTEINSIDESSIESILKKVNDNINKSIDPNLAKKIKISFHAFPETIDNSKINDGLFNTALYPDLSKPGISKQAKSILKKIMDFNGSLLALIFLLPAFLIIAIAIKLSSDGPVLFKQERMGLNGRKFSFLKFRSMYVNSDSKCHKEYIEKFIVQGKSDSNAPGVYKLSNDSRITPIGNVLRKTSLDELPQFFNVLKGEMSLVGPRPPIPYECELYDVWHKRRLLSAKPGITGLWQITGRSRTTFDEMVRLDLKYINNWSLWLDIKLLLQTPVVILTGKGAY